MSLLQSVRWTLSSLLLLSATSHADLIPFLADEAYERGDFGAYPYQVYQTSPLKGPRVNIVATNDSCTSNDDLIFLNPRGRQVVPGPNPMILDQAGNLVWTLDGRPFGETYNLNVQEWNGEQYLTFWGGDDTVGGHGQGYYYMVSCSVMRGWYRHCAPLRRVYPPCRRSESTPSVPNNRIINPNEQFPAYSCPALLFRVTSTLTNILATISSTRLTHKCGKSRPSGPLRATYTSSASRATVQPCSVCTKSRQWT